MQKPHTRRTSQPQEEEDESVWIVIGIIILALVIGLVTWLFSTGRIDRWFPEAANSPLTDTEAEARAKQERLRKALKLEENKALEARLNRNFRLAYAAIRILILALWGLVLYLDQRGKAWDLEEALNLSEAILLVVIAANFLLSGDLTDLKRMVDRTKIRVENWVWSKHINLKEETQQLELELSSN